MASLIKKNRITSGKYPYLHKLCAILINDNDQINETNIGYACGVLEALLDRRPDTILEFLLENQEYINGLLYHTNYDSCTEVIMKLLSNDYTTKDDFIEIHKKAKVAIVQQYIQILQHEDSIVGMLNCCIVLYKSITDSDYLKAAISR